MARTRQPQGAVRIDPRGFARNASMLWVGSVPFIDLAMGTPVSYFGYTANAVSELGVVSYSNTATGGNNNYIEFTNNAANGSGGARTIFILTKLVADSGPSFDSVFSNEGTANSVGIGLWGSAGADKNKPYFEVFDNSSTQTYTTIQNQAALSKTQFTLLVGVATAANVSLYQNGALVSQSNLIGSLPSANSYTWRIGRRSSSIDSGAAQIVALAGVLNEARSAAEVYEFSRNPWQIFAPQRRLWIQLGAAAGGSETTGTLSGTDGADAAAFSGAESIPGSLAATDGADAATFSGTHVENATGTLAATDGADVAAFAGTETFTGTLAATDGADAAAFTGQHTEAGVISGSLAATDGADAAAFDGVQTISGALAATDGADAGAFTGIHLQNITSTLDATDGADGATFSGTTAAEITGTLDATDGADEALFVSDQLGGRLLRRRRRYLIKDRVYNDLDPADVIAAAKEAGVDLGEVREVVKEPVQRKADPRHADDEGREYWLPQEFWGRAARQQRQEATSPLPADFWRAVAAIRPSGGLMVAASALQAQALRQRQEDEALLLLLS